MHRVGVFGDRRGGGAFQHRAERARRALGGTVDDEFDLRQIEIGSNPEKIDPGDQRGQADDCPEPDIQRAKEGANFRGIKRPRSTDNRSIDHGTGTANKVDHREYRTNVTGKRSRKVECPAPAIRGTDREL